MKRLLMTIWLCLILSSAIAKAPLVAVSELRPSDKHRDITQLITYIINSHHYRKKPINDHLSSSVFDKYLESLDPNRSFFLAEDIGNFSRYRYEFDRALLSADLRPAFDIFKVYRQRVKERTDYALAILARDFNFAIDEEYAFDRRELSWLSYNDLNDTWRKRVKNDVLNLRLAKKTPVEIKDTLGKRYRRIYTSTHQLNAGDVYQTFINAYTMSVDPHTTYFSPRVSENFDISMSLSLEGIGAVLRTKDEYTLVQRIIPGGPADISDRLHAKDKIIGVGQGHNGEILDVIGWRLDDVVKLIRGPKGTVLRLEVISGRTGLEDLSKIITLTRNEIKLEESAAQSFLIDVSGLDKQIGIIKIPAFYIDFAAKAKGNAAFKSTTRDVRRLLVEMRDKVAGVVIDLRSNGGGSLAEALALTGLFIEQGPVVQTKNSVGKVEVNYDPDPELFYVGPLAVLVDRHSASAAEIFAGAIQDYQRGIIIGEPTFGKGTVQNIIDLDRFIKDSNNEHGKLKTTVAQFFRISGGSNQNEGVRPDIIYPTAIDIDEYGERALDNSLPWDALPPLEFTKSRQPANFHLSIRALHENRIKGDKAFQLLLEQQHLIKANADRKTVSLMEIKRKQKRDQFLAAKHALENELRLLAGLAPLPAWDDLSEQDELEASEESESQNDEDLAQDILLMESARILQDSILFYQTTPEALQALETKATRANPADLGTLQP